MTFEEAVAVWRDETKFISNVTALEEHPAMQRIVAMGLPVIPLILEELIKHSDLLLIALYKITGENPVPTEHAGKIHAMVAAWIAWGKDRGFVVKV